MSSTLLADTIEQKDLLITQLERMRSMAPAAPFGSQRAIELNQMAIALKAQISSLEQRIEALTAANATEEERQALAEAEAQAKAEALAEAKAKALEVIGRLNSLSDEMAGALVVAASTITPDIIEALAASGYRLSGGWELIRPSTYGGQGRIAPLPYIELFDNGAMLTTRGKVPGKNIG